MLEALRSGGWLNPKRRRAWCLMAGIAFLATLVLLVAGSQDGLDFLGRPLGADYVNVWAAGQLVLQGVPEAAYDYARHNAAELALFPSLKMYFGWHYPPPFLLVAGLLGHLPYLGGLYLWMAAGLLLLLWASWGLRYDRLAAFAFPALFVNLSNGQNGLLSGALMLGGLRLLATRPWLAGLLLGGLSFKPQLGIALPLALAAAGHWRSFAGAALSVALLALVSWLALGTAPWLAFLGSLAETQHMVLENNLIFFGKMQGVFAGVRLWGGAPGLAWTVQAIFALAALWLVWNLWRRPDLDLADRSLALVLGTCLTTPYLYDYDLALLAAPLLLKAHGGRFRPWEISYFALLWVWPMLARPLGVGLSLPLTPAVCLLGLAHLYAIPLPPRQKPVYSAPLAAG